MLMRPNKGETVVHGCHCLGDLAVCMREVLARPWDGECVPLVLRFKNRGYGWFYFNVLTSAVVYRNLNIFFSVVPKAPRSMFYHLRLLQGL